MKSGEHFDVIIIGAGPSGIFCAYELINEKPEYFNDRKRKTDRETCLSEENN